MRDLDFGRVVADWLQQLDWPAGVVVEDLSCSAPLVLDRLRELRPAKVVLVGAVGRDVDPPGTIRRYTVDLTPPDPAEVHRSVEESVMGVVDLDHTLAMARHWGGLPPDTVVIEVEPAEASFGLGFSDVLAECLDPILEMIRDELPPAGPPALSPGFWVPEPDRGKAFDDEEPSGALDALRTYAEQHARSRKERSRAPSLMDAVSAVVPGVALAGRLHPWGVFVDNGGDWSDAVPLEGGAVGLVVGDVPGRGVEAASAMSDLRAAVRAYVVTDGESPAAVVSHLDRLARTTGLGQGARVMYLTLQPATGELRSADAGGCPPLLLDADGPAARFAETAGGPPLGGFGIVRQETTVRLEPGSTVLLFTDGLVQSRTVSRPKGMERLRLAATSGPRGLDELCAHVLRACTGTLGRDDDICILGVRRMTGAVPAAQGRPAELECTRPAGSVTATSRTGRGTVAPPGCRAGR